LGLPPFRPSRSKLLALLGDVLSVHTGADDNAKLRLRLIHKNISWQALIEFAQQQGALWPLIWALQQRSLLLPVPSPNNANHPTLQLVSAYRHHLARRERQRDQLLAIIGALNRSKIETLLLKGARHLAFQPGDWAEARDMRDIDLLVHPEQAELAAETLANLGYSADDSGAPLDDNACGNQSTRNQCEQCCLTVHPAGYKVYQAQLDDCVCNSPGACATECANEVCANQPTTPNDACSTCIQNSLSSTGACYQGVANACQADSDCTALFGTCIPPCENK